MRKHVAPASEGASIPDPARGRDLPREGLVLDWTPYWAGLAMRGDVVVSDPAEETVEEPGVTPQDPPADPAPADPTPATEPVAPV